MAGDWRFESGGMAGGDRFPDRPRGAPSSPPSKRRRDYEYPLGGERDAPPLYSRGDRYDDRGPRGTWRDGDPALRGRDAPPALGPSAIGPGGAMLIPGVPDDLIGGAPPPRSSLDPLMPPSRAHLPLNGGPQADLPPMDIPLPPDASPTLYIDNLPHDCSRREACHIFRPFIGFKEVRLVHKEIRRGPNPDTIVLCFVDFADARCAATAMEALQGYRFDESDYSSPNLRIDFARQGPRGFARDDRRDERDYGRGGGGYRRGPPR